MKIKAQQITLKKLIDLKEDIDPKPQYQRAPVWLLPKKKLLIDSILRGYDLPKFYLAEGHLFLYEAVDGQQRMRSIWEFVDNQFKLDESVIEGINIKGYSYADLMAHQSLKSRFEEFPISLSILTEFSQEEIRTLFARLQLGEKLNSVELRHAISSNIGFAIISLASNHTFFIEKECKIINGRYKHQDYLDNALTLCKYDGARNIKGTDMKHLYLEFANSSIAEFGNLLQRANKVLDYLKEINSYHKGMFKNKWGFVDIFYLLYKELDNFSSIDAKTLSDEIWSFELLRRANNKSPEMLIEDKTKTSYDKDLYDYIIAFKTGGALKENLKIRYRVFYHKFFNNQNFTLK
ncbi:DUF262 domain-containing protein [uncultured Pedobacter sp.]|uniref:DUF262 domain-containing protein n=1 Tax=uncultured Pedobacter sp. TaxID=246139 RepID=UPI0025E9689B|nr:DUF262 domain-containing protein [uncultured Pedobacter sp.]